MVKDRQRSLLSEGQTASACPRSGEGQSALACPQESEGQTALACPQGSEGKTAFACPPRDEGKTAFACPPRDEGKTALACPQGNEERTALAFVSCSDPYGAWENKTAESREMFRSEPPPRMPTAVRPASSLTPARQSPLSGGSEEWQMFRDVELPHLTPYPRPKPNVQ